MPVTFAQGIVLALWVLFVAIHTLDIGGVVEAFLFLVPGVLAAISLRLAGSTSQERFLALRRPSLPGLIALASCTALAAAVLLSGEWTGFTLLPAMVFAPASGVGQELYFRGALLPVLLKRLAPRRLLAVTLHAALFALWHLPLALNAAAPGALLPVVAVTFLGGMAWGWQVQRDGTLVWAAMHHTLLLMAMALFGLE
jgi:membrane protease YdiL (CAAX protease family)